MPSTAGTTASVAFLRKGKLYIGHCGDSGIVLGRTNPRGGKWIAQPLTTEHKPESPDELARIESFGGKVQQKQGIHRVVWYRPKNPHQGPIRRNTRIEEVPFLAVARSLGDLWSYNYKTQKFVVSPEPDVSCIEVDMQSFKCLIFASDGLWNVIDADFSVDSVYETERRNDQNAKLGISTWRNPSRVLVETALEKWRSNGLRADNTSVVCVMLDPPNKRNMYKFCRPTANDHPTTESQEGARTIFDYSTSEAYNLDYMGSDLYRNEGLKRQNACFDLAGDSQNSFYQHQLASNVDGRHFQFSGLQENFSSGYNSYETTYGFETASTSHQYQVQPGSLTYQATTNESAFVKACCRNNYLLASANEQIPYHSSYEQHREMYENMALRPYPPLHYAYRPVPASQHQQSLPLPSLQPNLYDHHGYLHNTHNNYKPMERYNYLRPTPEEIAALHNEEDENDSESDSNAMDFSDEESDDDEPETKEPTETTAVVAGKIDDSIQIFEISSSSFHNDKSAETDHSNDEAETQQFKKKPAKSNNKENTERSMRKKKAPAVARGRFYATRQTDRKMRSGNVGVTKTIGKEKNQRRITKNIRKVVKTLNEAQKTSKTQLPDTSRGVKKNLVKTNENKPGRKIRVLRSADTTFKKQLSDELVNVRSLRSNGNVMEKPRKRFDNIERHK